MSSNTPVVATAPNAEVDLAAAKREYRLLRGLVVFALWVSCALALSLNLADPDLWGHVRYGQDWLAEGTLPREATHTFTAEGYRWINHENLAELTFATLYAWLGDEGLLVAKCLLGLAILAAMTWVARRHGVGLLTMSAFLLLVANNLTAFFPVRPQLLSFAWCTLMLIVLDRAFTGWHAALAGGDVNPGSHWTPRRLLWGLLLIPIVVGWTNSHGAFVAGVAILGAYLGGRILEAIYYHRGRAAVTVAIIATIGLLSLAATLLNPYGYGLHQWLMASLGSPRPEITEWAAPQMSDPVFWPFVVLIGVCVAAWSGTRLRRDWVQIAILALVAWQAASHLRHIAFFALLCGFWLPPHLQSLVARCRSASAPPLPVVRLGTWSRWGLAAALLIAIGLQSSALYGRLRELPVYRNMYPVDAVQFMTDHKLHGKLVVSFNWAQYAIAALAPETTVSFDGRFRTCYPQQVIDTNFDFLLGEHKGRRFRHPDSGPVDPVAVLELGDPDLVLIDRSFKHAAAVMRDQAQGNSPEWTLLYQDGIAQLWGRASRYDDPQSPAYFSELKRQHSDHVVTGSLPWPALPTQRAPKALAELESGETPNEKSL